MSQNKLIKLFEINKSTLYYSKKGYPKNRKSTNRKSIDRSKILKAILKITKRRSTYGVPRIKAILKRNYAINASKYMINKIMKANNLLIKRVYNKKKARNHTGKISVHKPNMRWASDITSIKLWDGTKLRFTYVLDCCDRSIITWKIGRHMQACDIELMFQEALVKRFGQPEVPKGHELEFLHDNGPEYIENILRRNLSDWNVIDCNTPTYSPQSNGMCESFNGTFKRDYVYENCLDNKYSVINKIEEWVHDYNTFAPHSALEMKTPEEYYIFMKAA